MLERLCTTIGVSGYEMQVIELLKNNILSISPNDMYQDSIGNLICFRKGLHTNKRVLVSAHCDEVGLQITKIQDDILRFKALGNIKCYNLYQQRVIFENGCKGIILAYDIEKVEKYNYQNLYIKLFCQSEIEIGDICTFDNNYLETDDFFVSKGLDNRAGCFLLYQLLTDAVPLKYDTYFVFTAQEEIGLKGMKVALTHIKPDICITVDLTPECEGNNIQCGKGAAIKISDSISISDRILVSECKKVAQMNQVNYQLEVSNCGSSEIAIVSETGQNYKCLGISIPAKELHAANIMIKKVDIESTYQLLKIYLASLDNIDINS